jgi:hypothetical protein
MSFDVQRSRSMAGGLHDERTRLQLALLERMAAFDPPIRVMGGFAEDALVGGTVSRPHEDVDWAVMRDELPRRLEQAQEIGFEKPETWGESAPGEPFYLTLEHADGTTIDVGVFDEVDGHPVIDVSKLYFKLDGHEAPAGFRVHLPADAFSHPVAAVDGVPVWSLSPLALYQVRVGISSWGAFGELNEKQRRSLARLRSAFFADAEEDDLLPPVEPLDHG